MARIKNRSSLLAKYSLKYEKNPRSRVFAPLAETYRKLGMLDEAMQILKDGIRIHPSYTLGYIVLANCYFDIQNFELAYNTIRPFVAKNLENITMQKLFAKTCINLGHLDEALYTFKHLLLLNPRDSYVADQIKILEDDLLVDHEEWEDTPPKDSSQTDFDEDDWVQVDFSENEEITKPAQENILDSWKMKKNSPLDEFKSEVADNKIELKEHDLEDPFFLEDYDNHSDDVISQLDDEMGSYTEDKNPIITHTLVDLYCSQGHTDKAIQILENILELHPNDTASMKKLSELKGDNFVMSDSTSGQHSSSPLNKIYRNFQENIRKRAEEVRRNS